MIVIEIFEGDDRICTRQAGEHTFYYQQAYLHKPGARFPLVFQLPKDQSEAPYPVGRYTLSSEALLINQYHNLEISRFRQVLEPLPEGRA